jgi:hypothetical protein
MQLDDAKDEINPFGQKPHVLPGQTAGTTPAVRPIV